MPIMTKEQEKELYKDYEGPAKHLRMEASTLAECFKIRWAMDPNESHTTEQCETTEGLIAIKKSHTMEWAGQYTISGKPYLMKFRSYKLFTKGEDGEPDQSLGTGFHFED